MDFGSIVKLVMTLLGKKDDLMGIVQDIIALISKIKTVAPDLVPQLAALADKPTSPVATMSITWLQESLNKLGASITVDGKYGAATQEAVKKFQTAHGLTADGWAGVQTQAAIVDALG